MLGDFVLELMGTPYSQEESMMDRAASAGFEGIAQMLLEQKKLMDALEAENRELRRQIADLRRGVGMAVVIDGRTIQLAVDSAGGQASHQSQATLQSLQNGSSYVSRQTGGQQAIGGVGEKQNGNTRSPLADSFVL
jgi:hypothetical protein